MTKQYFNISNVKKKQAARKPVVFDNAKMLSDIKKIETGKFTKKIDFANHEF